MGREIKGLIEEGMGRVKVNVVDPVVNYFAKKPEEPAKPVNALAYRLKR